MLMSGRACTTVLTALCCVLSSGCHSNDHRMTAPTPAPVASCPRPEYVAAPTGGWPCPSAAEIDALRSSVRIEVIDDPTAPALVCRAADGSADLSRLEERLYQALLLMRRVQFDAPLPWTSRTLWEWFTDEVRGIRLRGSDTYCCDAGRVIVLGVRSSYEPGFPTLVEGLVHEARHADRQHPHTCGASADNTIAELGAYGVQYYLNVWLAEHSGPYVTEEEKRYSRNRADWMRVFSFCAECL